MKKLLPAMIAAAAMIPSSMVAAEDLQNYKDRFEALPHLPPIPADNSMTPAKIELGNMLFLNREFRLAASSAVLPAITLLWAGLIEYQERLGTTVK
ncbi:hypothetical protein [Vreelandella azerica]|uniref:hypothetical protein n=1 Tax=Vreelandella azerica TaxID=2732867 RepID=UPI001F3A29E0|nr:hypothetical protein [Halomonas azerica]